MVTGARPPKPFTRKLTIRQSMYCRVRGAASFALTGGLAVTVARNEYEIWLPTAAGTPLEHMAL